MSVILCMLFCIVLFAYFLSMLITAILLSRSCSIVDLKNVLMRRRALKDLSAEHEVARCRLAWDHALSLLSLYVSPLASSALEKKKREKKNAWSQVRYRYDLLQDCNKDILQSTRLHAHALKNWHKSTWPPTHTQFQSQRGLDYHSQSLGRTQCSNSE